MAKSQAENTPQDQTPSTQEILKNRKATQSAQPKKEESQTSSNHQDNEAQNVNYNPNSHWYNVPGFKENVEVIGEEMGRATLEEASSYCSYNVLPRLFFGNTEATEVVKKNNEAVRGLFSSMGKSSQEQLQGQSFQKFLPAKN